MEALSFSILIAWRDLGDLHRRAAFEWVHAYWRWALPDAEIVVCSDVEPFTKSNALNAAVERATADVFLHSDPDSFFDYDRAREALRQAAESDGLVVPFDQYVYLSESGTAAQLRREPIDWRPGPVGVEMRGSGGVGNATCFNRRTWEAVGGYDSRFGLWGGEDGAFAYATGTLVAPLRRLEGPVYHLYHPRMPESVPGHPEYVRQFGILGGYRDAADDPEAMREVMAGR